MIKITSQEPSSDQQYEYHYDRFAEKLNDPDVKYPMVPYVFTEDNSLSKGLWFESVVTLLLRIRSNQSMYDVAINQRRCSTFKLIFDIRLLYIIKSAWVKKLYSRYIRRLIPNSRKRSSPIKATKDIDEYLVTQQVKVIQKKELTAPTDKPQLSLTNYKDLFQIIYLPTIAYHDQEDRAFVEQRVAGPNPLVIERLNTLLDKFPITEAQYQSVMGSDDSLQQALAEQRLYITDYHILREIQPGTVEIDRKITPKYIYHPIALFAVEQGHYPNRRLVPIAIQCHQDPSPDNPIFTAPSLDSTAEERWAWQMAKLTVQVADANYHELISHLGGTHLRIEPIAIATYRKLPVSHPVGALLRPHFEGTLFINNSAVEGLVNPGGTVDKVAAGTLKSSLLLSVKGAQSYPYTFNDSALPNALKRRGVDDPNALPNYPYRDDALLLWHAIQAWVSSYLAIYYPNDTVLQNDAVLQAWIQDLTSPDGGQMIGIGEQLTEMSPPTLHTVSYLVEALTTIIFTSSAQHAAVNFPQSSYMTYINMPLAGYQPAPTSIADLDESSYIKQLPPLCQAETQMNMTYLLGSVYYTQLGQYGESYFSDSRVASCLKEFQDKLSHIELEIKARNEVRSTYYNVLLPSKIPQSINI